MRRRATLAAARAPARLALGGGGAGPSGCDAGARRRGLAAAVPALAGWGFDTLGSWGLEPQEPGAAVAAEAPAPAQA